MFRTVSLSVIKSLALYKQQWYMSYRFADSLLELKRKSTRLTSLLTIWKPKTVQIQSNPVITTSLYATPRL